MKKIFLLLIFFLGTIGLSPAQKPASKRLDEFIDSLEIYNKIMGSLVIAQKGEIVFAKSCGYSKLNNKEKIKNSVLTHYRVGSISKMFTSVMILQLIEEKKLSLDTHLSDFFPGIPNAGSITVKQMLNHHSGIHNYTENQDDSLWMTRPISKENMIKLLSNQD